MGACTRPLPTRADALLNTVYGRRVVVAVLAEMCPRSRVVAIPGGWTVDGALCRTSVELFDRVAQKVPESASDWVRDSSLKIGSLPPHRPLAVDWAPVSDDTIDSLGERSAVSDRVLHYLVVAGVASALTEFPGDAADD